VGRQGKAHSPTPAQRAAVEESVGLGGSQRVIAKCLGISRTTLEKCYRHELDVGAEIACEKVAKSLFDRAVDPKSGMSGTVAAIFFLKARGAGNWKDVQSIEHAGPDGGALPSQNNILILPDNGRDHDLVERLRLAAPPMKLIESRAARAEALSAPD
jgi:hypothetical protein